MSAPRPSLHWLNGFTIPEHPTGAVIAVTFGADGVWMGRVHGRAGLLAQLVEPRIMDGVLDRRIVASLVAAGKLPLATSQQSFDDALALAREARESIDDRDTVLVRGPESVGIVGISREDFVEATVLEVNRLHGMVVELAGRDPVDAILLGPGTSDWPGLWEAFTERGFTALLAGDAFPVTFGGNNDATGALDRVADEPQSLAWASVPAGTVSSLPLRGRGRHPELYADALVVDPPVVEESPEEIERREVEARRRLRWTATAAAVVLLALGGVGAAFAMNVHEHLGPDAGKVDREADPTPPLPTETPTSAPMHIPTSADKSEMAAARAEMIVYTTPPPPPPPKPKVTQRPPGQRPAPGPNRPPPVRLPRLPRIIIR